jgi:hypothetical protein
MNCNNKTSLTGFELGGKSASKSFIFMLMLRRFCKKSSPCFGGNAPFSGRVASFYYEGHCAGGEDSPLRSGIDAVLSFTDQTLSPCRPYRFAGCPSQGVQDPATMRPASQGKPQM